MSSTAGRADVAQELALSDGALSGDEGVNGPLQDLALSPDACTIRTTEDGLEHKSAQEKKRRSGVHDGLKEGKTAQRAVDAVLGVKLKSMSESFLDLHGDIYMISSTPTPRFLRLPCSISQD